jgi:hypothetical protein
MWVGLGVILGLASQRWSEAFSRCGLGVLCWVDAVLIKVGARAGVRAGVLAACLAVYGVAWWLLGW